jgi:hypothetical protein
MFVQDESDWQLIEHIRATGQLGSGAILNEDRSSYDLIYESDAPQPLDKNAPERLLAEKEMLARAYAAAELKKFLNSDAQKRKRQALREQREHDREAMLAEQRRAQEAYRAAQVSRRHSQMERDALWEAAGKEAAQRLAEAKQVWEARQRRDEEMRRVWEEKARRAAEEKKRLEATWATPQVSEVSVWWNSGRLAFLPVDAQPLQIDWHRLTGRLAVTMRNAAGLIATIVYQEGTHEIALSELLTTCRWLEGHKVENQPK